ncbi:MAG: hypothetical protein ABIR84_08110 [Candidatus Nitrotoga sp.]
MPRNAAFRGKGKTGKGDISTLQERGHFYLALTMLFPTMEANFTYLANIPASIQYLKATIGAYIFTPQLKNQSIYLNRKSKNIHQQIISARSA